MRLDERRLNSIINSVLNENMYEAGQQQMAPATKFAPQLWELGQLEELAEENPDAQQDMPENIADNQQEEYEGNEDNFDQEPEEGQLEEQVNPWNAESIILNESRAEMEKAENSRRILNENVLLHCVKTHWNSPATRLINK